MCVGAQNRSAVHSGLRALEIKNLRVSPANCPPLLSLALDGGLLLQSVQRVPAEDQLGHDVDASRDAR